MFAQSKDDRKRVEKALDISGLPSGKVKYIFSAVKVNDVSRALNVKERRKK